MNLPKLLLKLAEGRCVRCGQCGYVVEKCELCCACLNISLLLFARRKRAREMPRPGAEKE